MTALAEDTLWAQYLGADLKPTRAWTAQAGGKVVALATLPDGGVAALVQPSSGPPVLAGWGAGGKASPPIPLTVQGPIVGAERRRDGSWLVLTGQELLRLGADGKAIGRRAVPSGQPAPQVWAVGHGGAWLGWDDRLLYLPLDGPEQSWRRPFQEPPREICAEEFKRPEDCRYQILLADLAPVGEDRCLVIESLVIHHDARGPNRTEQAALTLVDGAGRTLARRLVGEVTSSLQWFNFDHSGGNLSGLPGAFSLVRRSYHGSTSVWLIKALGEELLLSVRSGRGTSLERVDATLRPRWSRRAEVDAVVPAWTRGTLLFFNSTELRSFDDDGTPRANGSLFQERYGSTGLHPPAVQLRDVPDRSELRNAIGQTPAGEWLLVSY